MKTSAAVSGLRAYSRRRSILADDQGQGIAEYVIILAVIVVAGILLVTAFGDELTTVWESVTTQFGTLA